MTVVSTFLFGYGMLRFFNEFFRADSTRYLSMELTGAQFISLIFGALGVSGIFWASLLRKQQSVRLPPSGPSNGFSLTELLAVVAIVSLLASLLLPALGRAREGVRRASCQSNLRSWGQIFAMYSSEASNRRLPPMQFDLVSFSDVDLALAPRIGAVFPEYATSPALLRCPGDSLGVAIESQDAILDNPSMADLSYIYTGFVFDKVGEANPSRPLADLFDGLPLIPATALHEARNIVGPAQFLGVGRTILARTTADCLWPLADDLVACGYGVLDGSQHAGTLDGTPLGNGGGTAVQRLEADSGRHIEGGASTVWVMFDSISTDVSAWNHTPGGSNVLFLDGHVEFVPYPNPGNGVINRRMASILEPILKRPR